MTEMTRLIERESFEEYSIINTRESNFVSFSAKKGDYMQLLNVNELADFLKIKKSTIYDWTHRGVIPYLKIGKLLRFDQDAINEWVKNNSCSKQGRP